MKAFHRLMKRLLSWSSKRRDLAHQINDVGVTLARQGRIDDAIVNFTAAIDLNPNEAGYWVNLGNALQNSGKAEDACRSYEKGSKCKNASAVLYDSWGLALASLDRLTDSLAAHKKALALDPEFSGVLTNLGNTYRVMGRLTDALMNLDAAIAKTLRDRYIAGARLYTLNFIPSLTAEEIAAEHKKWPGADIEANVNFPNSKDPARLLKVGYVSSDFRMHACANFLLPLFQHHNRDRVHITGFGAIARPDRITKKFKDTADDWIDISSMTESAFVDSVRTREIDILVECGGHTTSSKLGSFTHRPAPVQVSWLGYPNTTGLTAIDYRLTDRVATPPDMADLFTEEFSFLADGFHTYRPLSETPKVMPPPVLAKGHITFGAIHNLAKISEPTLTLYAAVLKEVPESRLFVKAKSLTDEAVLASFKDRCEKVGIDLSRLTVHPWSTAYEIIFNDLQNVDIELDATPYNGTTSTCDALWMGIPVVTLCGDRPSARVGASLLTQVGHPEWIAQTDTEYVRIAKRLASDRQSLAKIRETLRSDLLNSTLGNAAKFAESIENAYRSMWQDWCESHAD